MAMSSDRFRMRLCPSEFWNTGTSMSCRIHSAWSSDGLLAHASSPSSSEAIGRATAKSSATRSRCLPKQQAERPGSTQCLRPNHDPPAGKGAHCVRPAIPKQAWHLIAHDIAQNTAEGRRHHAEQHRAASPSSVPAPAKRPGPTTSGHWITRAVGAMCLVRMNIMDAAHRASSTRSHRACAHRCHGRGEGPDRK